MTWPASFDFWDFPYPVQDALSSLRWDIRDGFKSDFEEQTVTTYQHMQTRNECRDLNVLHDFMIDLMVFLGDAYDVKLYCDEGEENQESLGDFLAVNGFWDGEAA